MRFASRTASIRIISVVFALLLLVECASVLVDRQDWSDEWGPLVPHKTFPGDCSLCHISDDWRVLRKDFKFDHAAETSVELRGAHARAACLRCHNDFGPVEMYAARGCAGCHIDIHRSQLGMDCTSCHNENTWRPIGLVGEHANTRFPLVGRHAATACVLCHERAPTGDYRGAPLHCDQCHMDDLRRAAAPDHRRLGWVNRCERCHIPTSWGGAGFTHSFYPLTGQHAVINCNACHIGDTFGRLPRDCFSCHMDDHARAEDHDIFGLACQQCHNTTTWEGAVFNHRFPIKGPHKLDCIECHVDPNPRNFDCLSCHEHNRIDTDKDHDEVAGYTYDSPSCVRCHPNGKN